MEYKGFIYTPTPKTAWDSLSMQEKSEMMKVAVRNGITDLKTIKEKYNEFAEGGDTKWTMEDEAKYMKWRQSLPDNLRLTNDNDYDMRAAFKAGMQPTLEADGLYHLGSRYPKTGRILKAPHHPTYLQAINIDARMGYYPVVDDKGQTYTQTWEGNKFAEGGIHIKPENRGKFTALKERTRHSTTWFKEHGTPAQRKMATFALNARHWKHGLGGNLFDGTTKSSQQMQVDRPFWQSQTQQPSFMENLAEFNRQQEIKKQQKRQTLRERINTVGKRLAEERVREASIESNDNAWVETPLLTRKKNTHLSRRAEKGAKQYAAWEKEHPVLNTIGAALGASPFAVAATPLFAAAGEAAAPVLTNHYVDAVLTSGFGAHGLNHAINEGIDGWGDAAMTALEVTPLGRVIKPMAKETASAVKTLYDNGTLWDAYTTFGGRFGNYGDNIFTNIYGTAARRFGLPDKVRVPADGMRKLSQEVNIKDGLVDFTGEKGYNGNYHINASLDRPVVSHSLGNWDRNDLYIFPTRNFLKQTQGALKSIEPSDMFANGVAYREVPKNVTVVSGDVDILTKARDAGMQTLSSPKLRRLYKKIPDEYQAELEEFNNTPLSQRYFVKTRRNAKYNKSYKEYADEVQRLQSQRGTPTLADFRLLEEQTGLNAGVAPISEYNNALSSLQNMRNIIFSPRATSKIQNNEVTPYIFPNGRSVDWSIKGVLGDLSSIKRAGYNKVFYDPTSPVESIWRFPDSK